MKPLSQFPWRKIRSKNNRNEKSLEEKLLQFIDPNDEFVDQCEIIERDKVNGRSVRAKV
jgi:hypothetical protein